MADALNDAYWVLMPPEFEYLGSLFLPDLRRARLAARLALAVEAWRGKGRSVFLDPGADGHTARQVADALAKSGARAAVVVGTDFDRTGASILCEALDEAGISCEDPLLSRVDGDDILAELACRVEARTFEGASQPEESSRTRDPGGFMILEEGESPPRQGAAFRKTVNGLVRESGGAACSIRPMVKEIRLILPDGMAPRETLRKNGLMAVFRASLAGEGEPAKMEPWLALCKRIIESAGPENFRLSIGRTEPAQGAGLKGAAWAARCGLHSSRFRDFLLELVSRHLPDRLGLLQAVLGFQSVCADPLEEMYGGCSLPDRNQCLIENIVP